MKVFGIQLNKKALVRWKIYIDRARMYIGYISFIMIAFMFLNDFENETIRGLLDDNKFFSQDFRATFGYSAGGEFRLPGTGIALRGGYRIQPSPIIFADEILNREYISAGIGYNFDGSTVFNFGYTVGSWKKYSYDSYTPSGTSEKIKSERFMAGITFRI